MRDLHFQTMIQKHWRSMTLSPPMTRPVMPRGVWIARVDTPIHTLVPCACCADSPLCREKQSGCAPVAVLAVTVVMPPTRSSQYTSIKTKILNTLALNIPPDTVTDLVLPMDREPTRQDRRLSGGFLHKGWAGAH